MLAPPLFGCIWSSWPCPPALQLLAHSLEKFLLQGPSCGHFCLLSHLKPPSSSVWMLGGPAHSTVLKNSQPREWHILLLQRASMHSWAGCALHNSDFARSGVAHSCTMGHIGPCLHCRVYFSLSISSLFPGLLKFMPPQPYTLGQNCHEELTDLIPRLLPFQPPARLLVQMGRPLSPDASMFIMTPHLVTPSPTPCAAPFS